MLATDAFPTLIHRYRSDSESVYNTWFVNGEERLKAFRSIRRGVVQVIQDIKDDRFPNDFRGSSLEVVLGCITEQKQVFEGAAHAFYWKPKLRIPDIYESDRNKIAFGQFLEGCVNATREDQLLREISFLSQHNIKGLGPAVANILYFLHPTMLPPFNTAIVKGFNRLFNRQQKLGRWDSYLEIRDLLMSVNERFRSILSKDLGALAGFLFEIGAGRLAVAENAQQIVDDLDRKERAAKAKRHVEVEASVKEDHAHTQMQHVLIRVGKALNYDVVVAANDRGRSFSGDKFSFHCLSGLPSMDVAPEVLATIDLIDVVWLFKGTNRVACAFEVEKSTSIYSGILRLVDLSLALPGQDILIGLIAPDCREKEVVAQLLRPSIASQTAKCCYLLFSDLLAHCDAVCRFGSDHHILEKLVKRVHRLDVTVPVA